MAATHGFEVVLKYGDSSPASTTLGGVIDFTPPEQTVSEVDTTTRDSVDSNGLPMRTFIGGILETGTMSFTIQYVKATHNTLEALKGVTKYWLIEYQDGSTDAFEGFITKYGVTTEMDDQMQTVLDVKVAGEITFTAAT